MNSFFLCPYKKCVLLFLILFSTGSHAFRPDTHVWIAQEVLNDASDGKLKFYLKDKIVEIPIDEKIKSALSTYPDMYRMGNIGPDAIPDIITGQSVIHPGIDGVSAWKTDDWMEWIYSSAKTPEQIAFAYGFLGHAAADVFAHTYVNMYSGGFFDLFDGENDIEKRHLALELFISSKTPPLTDRYGRYIGLAKSNIAVPDKFIVDSMIFNDVVAAQYKNSPAKHFYLIHELRKDIQFLIDGPIHDTEVYLIKKIAKDILGIELSDSDAEKILDIQKGVRGAIVSNMENLQKIHSEVFSGYATAVEMQGDFVAIANSTNLIYQHTNALSDLNLRINSAQKELDNTKKYIEEKTKDCFALICKVVTKTVVSNAWKEKNNILLKLIDERSKLSSSLLEQNNHLKSYLSKINSERVNGLSSVDDIFYIMVELGKIYGGGSSPIGGLMENWKNDIYLGMQAYVTANRDVIKKSMHYENEPLKPAKDWLACWGASVFAPIPSVIVNNSCNVYSTVNNAVAKINDVRNKIIERFGKLHPLVAELNKLEAEIKSKINKEIEAVQYEIFEAATGVEVAELVEVSSKKFSTGLLNQQFRNSNSIYPLITIADVEGRVGAEMYLNGTYFDKTRYLVIRNSLVLAKLSLLNSSGLNQLAAEAGVGLSPVYGVSIFGGTGNAGDKNIIFNAIKNIDGNHQWREIAPPYPRTTGVDVFWPSSNSFGYSSADKMGFRIWQDTSSREKLFKSLFVGPLSPGIESPEPLGFSKVFPSNYSYNSLSDLGVFFAIPNEQVNSIENYVINGQGQRYDNDGVYTLSWPVSHWDIFRSYDNCDGQIYEDYSSPSGTTTSNVYKMEKYSSSKTFIDASQKSSGAYKYTYSICGRWGSSSGGCSPQKGTYSITIIVN